MAANSVARATLAMRLRTALGRALRVAGAHLPSLLGGVLAVGHAGSAALLAGCSSWGTLEPWVKPYERERLADPIMKFSRNALADKHSEHVRNVREAVEYLQRLLNPPAGSPLNSLEELFAGLETPKR